MLQYLSILESVFQNIPYMVFVKDAENLRFVIFNKAGEDLTGFKKEEFLGKSDYDLFPKEEADFFTQKDREVLKNGKMIEIPQEPIQTRNKGMRILNTKKVPIILEEGRFKYLLGISEDITDRLKNEEALKKHEGQMIEVQKMEAIGRLAGGIAHDFNNLLTAINGFTDLILGTLPKNHESYPDLIEIKHTADRASNLTRQLLAFSHQQVLESKVVNLNSVAIKMKNILQHLVGEDIILSIKTTPGSGQIRVDPNQIEQVILNLVINSRDAMPRGGQIQINVGPVVLRKESGQPNIPAGDYVLLEVNDNGTGIPKDAMSHIFEPFFTTKERGKGTGLGLSTVYGIVKQSGGHVAVESKIGKGTDFKIYLPRVNEQEPAEKEPVKSAPTAGSEFILLVEDEVILRNLTKRILKGYGYQVMDAANGVEALKLYERWGDEIDLVLTDVVMPEMGGGQLAEEIRKTRPDTKFLFISGYAEDTVAAQRVLDASGIFLPKPFSPDVLAKKIREAIGHP